MPPARSGVADYSAALLRALSPYGGVKVNACDADVPLYHLGNNQLHGEIYGHALKTPGVTVLHDAVLHHFFLGGGDEQQYVAEFVYNYGHWSEDLARELWRRRSRSAADPEYFRYPMIKRVAERSRAVIVHNPRAAALVHEHVRGTTVHEIPHLFTLPADLPSQAEVLRWRAGLGIAPRTFLVGVFGHLRESKRLLALLRAFRRARHAADMMLLVAGDFVSSDLARAAEPLLRNDAGIVRIGYLDERDFWLCACGRGRLHQPALPHGRRNLRDRDSADGPGQDRAGERGRRDLAFPRSGLRARGSGAGRRGNAGRIPGVAGALPRRLSRHRPACRRAYSRTSRARPRGRPVLAGIDGLLP